MTNFDNMPLEMQKLDQWVLYDANKHPLQTNGKPASTSDPSTWRSFKAVEAAYKNRHATGRPFEGGGFVFTENDPYVPIDLDKVIDDDGVIDPKAQAIVDSLDSYTEISQGKHGLHIIVRGEKPGSRCKKGSVEIYEQGRYIAITGDLWQGRDTINDRQAELNSLYDDTFGSVEDEAAPVSVGDLVLDRGAMPPAYKLDILLKDREFKKTWGHKREDFKSLSEYDLSLAGFAIRRDWTDQEAANLIIAFRRQHGNDSDLKKVTVRKDYIETTLSRVKPKIDTADVLGLLPFKVVRLHQYGVDDSEYNLELEGGKKIQMGKTEDFLSAKKAKARLYDHSYELSNKAMKWWDKITMELRNLVEITETVTREDTSRSWIDDYINARISLPVIETKDDIGKMFGSGLNSIATDKKGRIYLRLSDITRYVRVHTGLPGISTKTVAHDLVDLGFENWKVSVTEEGKRKQIRIWVSAPSFIDRVSEEVP